MLTYLVLAGKRTGNITAGGATALVAGAREECLDVRAVCPEFDRSWCGWVNRSLGVRYGVV